ncbi:MAG: hypothetical protein ACKO1I_10615 [Microcystis aeruginosa]
MTDLDNTQPTSSETIETNEPTIVEPSESVAAVDSVAEAKPKRKPKQSKIMKVAVNPTEYFDDEAPAKPDNIVQPEVVEEVKPKSKAKAKAKSKVKVVEAVPEPVLEQVLEPVLEPVEVKPKRSKTVKKPKQVETVEPTKTEIDHNLDKILMSDDFEELISKRMKLLRDTREQKKKEKIQELIAQAI